MFPCSSLGYRVAILPDDCLINVPFDRRVNVSPSGERCRLIVSLVTGPWAEPWWAVELLNGQNVCPIAGVASTMYVQDRELARQIYRARLMALKTAGWRRA